MLTRFSSSGFGLMVFAAFVYAISDIINKFLTSSLPIPEIFFVRFFLGGIILWPVLSYRRTSLKGNHVRFLILRGIFGTLSFFFMLKSMTMIPLSLVMVLFYTFPIFVAFISSLWLGEKIGKKELFLIAIGLIGICILINPGSHAFNQGYVFGLLASLIGAMAMVMIRKARETNGAMIIYFYFCMVGGTLSFPFFLYHFKWPDLEQGVLLLFLGLSLLIAQVMMNQAFKYCKAAEGSMVMMSEVVFTGIAGILLFKEQMTLHFWAGALLIVGSGFGLNWMNRRP
jgi:drug/metabolite transporter (DMT)-like permease